MQLYTVHFEFSGYKIKYYFESAKFGYSGYSGYSEYLRYC